MIGILPNKLYKIQFYYFISVFILVYGTQHWLNCLVRLGQGFTTKIRIKLHLLDYRALRDTTENNAMLVLFENKDKH